MNILLSLRLLGHFFIGLAAIMVLPLAISLYYQESKSVAGFSSSILLVGLCGVVLLFLKPQSKKLNNHSSIILVVLSWISFGFACSLPYLVIENISITNSVFESISGLSTTGATIFSDIEALSKSLLFWRSLTQWLGGMGIILLSLAILPVLGAEGSVLYKAETPGPTSDKILPRLQTTAKILWITYCFFTLACILLYKCFGMRWFDAICHSFTTISTGGFSTKNNGFNYFNNSYLEWTAIIFMFLGGINFFVHYKFFVKKSVFSYLKNKEFILYSSIILCFTFGILFALILERGFQYIHFSSSVRSALFQVTSIISTTGFINSDYELWPYFAQCLILILFFIGGCSGSTAGGVKVIRIYVLIQLSIQQLKKAVFPQRVYPIKIGYHTLSVSFLQRVIGFVSLYIFLWIVGALLLTLCGHDLITSFSAVGTSLGNLGPGFGDVGPVNHFGHIHPFAKWVLIVMMIAGRLEIFTLLVVFSRHFWKN